MTESQWYVLRVEPGREQRAEKLMRVAGYHAAAVVRPALRRKTRHCIKRTEVMQCAAPGYLFALMSQHDLWRLHNLHFIWSVLSVSGAPARFNPEAVAKFLEFPTPRWREDQRHMRTGHEFAPGDTVEILSGPLRDRTLMVDMIDGREAQFFVHLLGRDCIIGVDIDDCERAA